MVAGGSSSSDRDRLDSCLRMLVRYPGGPYGHRSVEHLARRSMAALAVAVSNCRPLSRPVFSLLSATPLRWLASCSLAAAAAWIAIPRDEAWKDMWPEQSTWMAAIVVGTLWNQWSIEDLIDRQAERWGVWVLIGCSFPVFFLSAICYATMAQWVLVCIASAMGIALVGLVHPAKWMSVLAPLLSLMMAAMMAWTRFRGTLQPVWLYLLLLFAPTMIAAVDRLAARRGAPWIRVVVAGVLTIGVSVVTAIQAMPSGHEEW